MEELFSKEITALPSSPQLEAKSAETKEKPSIFTISETLPQGEGNEVNEGFVKNTTNVESVTEYSETFSDKINPNDWPPLMKDIADTQMDLESKDTMILGALDTFSGAMPNCFGIYDQRRVFPPFYLIIYAPPSSDKGNLKACMQLVEPIEQQIETENQKEQEKYQKEMVEYLALDKTTRISLTPPKEPAYKSLWIPANSSASACYQALSDNDNWGLTFETEADTLTIALNSEYGNFSDGLRKAFHHETISLRRRKEHEFFKIEEPRWAVCLTCTPGQIPLLFSSLENGLGSRFLFYRKRRRLFWRDVFEKSEKTIEEQFLEFGQRYKTIYDELVKRKDHPMQLIFSKDQQVKFNSFFEELQIEQVGLYGDDMIAFVRRLGLVCFRIAMVLTILRYEGCMPIIEPLSQAIVCDDRDFNTAMTIVNCLISHTAHVYSEIFDHNNDTKKQLGAMKMSNQEKQLFIQLSDEFTTDDVRQLAKKFNIPWKTAEHYLGKYVSKYRLAVRVCNGHYKKIHEKDRYEG